MTTPIVVPPVDSDNLKQCNKCHEWKPREAFPRDMSRRDGLNGRCKGCATAMRKAWRAANLERDTEMQKSYRMAHKERQSEAVKAWLAVNKEHNAETQKAWRAANAERMAEYGREYRQTDAGKAARRAGKHNRRARKAGNGGTCTASDLIAIRAAQTDKHGQLRCWRCGRPIKGTPHLDHWQPLKHGGRNDAGNLHYMHAKCNLEKGAKHPTELGRLV